MPMPRSLAALGLLASAEAWLVQPLSTATATARAPLSSLALSENPCPTTLPKGQRHFVHVDDLSGAEVREVLELAKEIKSTIKTTPKHGYTPFDGQTLSMVFTKPSTRTRVSFESGFFRLGGHALCLGAEVGIGTREATKDVSRVLAGMNEMVMARLYEHKDMVELAEYSSVPVINGLTDYNHPCQIMADALTIEEVLGSIEGKKVVYCGDGNNIVHSWLELAMVMKFDFVCACPEGFEPDKALMAKVASSGVGTATVSHKPMEAVKGADVIYSDVWASMQEKDQAEARTELFKPFQVNEELMAATGNEETIFLHCLPAEREREVTDGVMESAKSFVFQQAENRMHAQNAIMVFCANAERPPKATKGGLDNVWYLGTGKTDGSTL